MNSFTVICPNCKSEIPLNEAVTHQFEGDFKRRQTELEQSVAAREKQLSEQQAKLEKAQNAVDKQVAQKIAIERSKLTAAAMQEAKATIGAELQEVRILLEDRQKKLIEAQQAELGLRKRQSELESRAEALELEVTRKLDEERGKIRAEAQRAAVEAEALKILEKDTLISEMQRQITILKHKADQGSQQLQGEVLELNVEAQLRAAFPYDEIEPVSKGVKGADIVQHVRTNAGQECGSIVWEAKRCKAWSSNWTGKLREDQRTLKAELAVMVSLALPNGTRNFGMVDGVWVCDCWCMVALATALRQGLVGASVARLAETGKQGKMEELYQYLCSIEFRQHVEGMVESFVALERDLAKERRAMDKMWAARQKQIGRALRHTALMYGGIQGIAGGNVLPDLKPLQLEAPTVNGDSESECNGAK